MENKYKFSDLFFPIAVAIKDAKDSPYDRFVGLEHYDSLEPVISRYTDTSLLSSSVKEFHSGDMLIARRNVYLRRAGLAIFDGLTSGDSIVLRLKGEDEMPKGVDRSTLNRILPFVLNSDNFWIYANKHADGMNSKRISIDNLLNYEFDLPPLAEQKVLSDKLWAAYEVKQSYLRMIETTDEMVKAQFVEMFEGDKYTHITLDEASQDWLKGQPFKKEDMVENGKLPCIHYGELFTKYGPIIENVISHTNIEPIRLSKIGDILFPASDVTPNGLTRCSMLSKENVVLGGDIIVLRPKKEYDAGYLSCAINQQKSQLLKRVNGAVIKHLSTKGLKTVLIPKPPKEKQVAFVSIVHQADKSKAELRKSIEAIDKVIKAIINENI